MVTSQEVRHALDHFYTALEGDSGDTEISAANDLADILESLLKDTGSGRRRAEPTQVVHAECEPAQVPGSGKPMAKYPDIVARLIGQDGNGFMIIAHVNRLLMEHDVPANEREDFMNDAMSGDYNHLLQTVMKWVTVT